MQKSELSNPAPSRGFRDFPKVGNHYSHSEPNRVPQTGLQKASVHNTVFHPAANANATYPFFCGRYTSDWQKGFVEGSTAPNFVQRFVQKYALNEALIPREPTTEEIEEKYKIDASMYEDSYIQELKDAEFILDFKRKYRFIGIVLTDMDTSSNYQKLFNLNVRGRSRVFNMWTTRLDSQHSKGGQARDKVLKNDKLYFVLKKCKRDELTYKQPDGASMALTPPTREDGMVWQLKTARLSLRQKPKTYDENGNQQLYIYCGQVLNAVSKKPDEHYVRRSFREHTQQSCLPLIEIALSTGQY